MHRLLGFCLVVLCLPLELAARTEPFSEEEQARHHEALELIPFNWKALGYEIVFMPPKRGFRAMTFVSKRRIEVYARPADDVRLLAQDIAHELGHAIDLSFNTSETRRQWMQSRGIAPSTPWFTCKQCSDYNSPSGDFAETFAVVLLGPQHFRGRIAPAPTDEKLLELLAFFPIAFLQSTETAVAQGQ